MTAISASAGALLSLSPRQLRSVRKVFAAEVIPSFATLMTGEVARVSFRVPVLDSVSRVARMALGVTKGQTSRPLTRSVLQHYTVAVKRGIVGRGVAYALLVFESVAEPSGDDPHVAISAGAPFDDALGSPSQVTFAMRPRRANLYRGDEAAASKE